LEDVKRLVIISSNSTYDDLGNELQSDGTKVVAEDSCLPGKYAGTMSGTRHPWHAQGYQPPNESWSGTVTFTKYTGSCSGEWWCFNNNYQTYEVESGSVDWHISGTIYGNCTIDQTDTFPLAPNDPDGLSFYLLVQKKPAKGQARKYYGSVIDPYHTTISYTCPSGGHTGSWNIGPWWLVDELDPAHEATGGHLQGTFSLQSDYDSNFQDDWTWDFSSAD
jgi:hypothetical protein